MAKKIQHGEAGTYSEPETDARREATLRRMLETPHKPHKAKAGAEKHRPR